MQGPGSDQEMMAAINVTPLVDVMLVLLVVFILTAPLLVPQTLGIKLPHTAKVKTSAPFQKSQLAVSADGSMKLDQQPVDDSALTAALRTRAADPHAQLQIDADNAVPYGRVAQILALAQNAGVGHISFVTERSTKP